MSNMPPPIAPDAPICQTLHCLTEKFVVDFANGIDVSRDHVRVQRERSSFFARMYDGFTGQGARRQAIVNASLTDGVEASLQWLGELSESLAHSQLALTQVNNRVTALTQNVASLAHYSAETRLQLEEVAHRLDTRMQGMAKEIAHIGFIQQAQLNMDSAFAKWASGRFVGLSPTARCYATLEELRWGALGDFCRSHGDAPEGRQLMQMVADQAITLLEKDATVSQQATVPTAQVWLAAPPVKPGSDGDDMRQALAYMADGMTADRAPFTATCARTYVGSTVPAPDDLPLRLPRIANARRVAEAMVGEVFPQESCNV